MDSSGHRANILKPAYNRVGIGVVHSGGKIWVTVRFLQGPAISRPRAATQPVAVKTALTGDFDGDGYDDLLTYNPGTTGDELWFGRANGGMHQVTVTVNGQYRPVAGDFDGDGRTQILWYAPGSAADSLWEWDGDSWAVAGPHASTAPTARSSATSTATTVDDLLWYAPGSAGRLVLVRQPQRLVHQRRHRDQRHLRPAGRRPRRERRRRRVLVRHGQRRPTPSGTRTCAGASYSNRATTVNGTYSPFAGDFDGNGTDDLFWYAPGSAADSAWYTNHTPGQYTSVARQVTNSYVPGAGDFDGNGTDDIVWFSPSSASGDTVWLGTQGTRTYSVSSVHAG